MKVSIRSFQLRANDYLTQLPIELTRYGRVVAIVSKPSSVGIAKKKEIDAKSEKG